MTRQDLATLLFAADSARERGDDKTADAIAYVLLRVSTLESLLAHLRDRPGECLGDNPKWMAKIEELIGPRQEATADDIERPISEGHRFNKRVIDLYKREK